MAAQVLATAGLSVTVHDHMPSVGRKLLLAGRSGLNMTHSEPMADLLARFGSAAQRLEPAITAFGPAELREWSAALGESTFVGSSGRVFPSSFRATPLLRAWLAHLRTLNVSFVLRDRWTGWVRLPDGAIDGTRCSFDGIDGATVVTGDVTVLALGGASWPRVGSNGGWVDLLRSAGIDVRTLRPANCGVHVAWRPDFVDRFAGVPLKNVAVTVAGIGVRGDAVVTTTGLEGGPVYAVSTAVRDGIDRDGVGQVVIDLQPDLSVDALARRLERRRAKESLTTCLRRTIGLSPVAIALLSEVTGRRVPDAPVELATLVKAVPVTVVGVAPLDRAISSSGGIALDEVNESFMLRRLPGTFVAGEMLNWDAPTGGYLLQASFSTAVAAANGALQWIAGPR
jgi:uncharacterized flavoprotein (TIGR03862 family)